MHVVCRGSSTAECTGYSATSHRELIVLLDISVGAPAVSKVPRLPLQRQCNKVTRPSLGEGVLAWKEPVIRIESDFRPALEGGRNQQGSQLPGVSCRNRFAKENPNVAPLRRFHDQLSRGSFFKRVPRTKGRLSAIVSILPRHHTRHRASLSQVHTQLSRRGQVHADAACSYTAIPSSHGQPCTCVILP